MTPQEFLPQIDRDFFGYTPFKRLDRNMAMLASPPLPEKAQYPAQPTWCVRSTVANPPGKIHVVRRFPLVVLVKGSARHAEWFISRDRSGGGPEKHCWVGRRKYGGKTRATAGTIFNIRHQLLEETLAPVPISSKTSPSEACRLPGTPWSRRLICSPRVAVDT